MPGIGLQSAYGLAGAQDQLQKLLAQRMEQEKIKRDMAQQEFENQMRQQEFGSNEELKRMQFGEAADNRAMTQGRALDEQIQPGTDLPFQGDPRVGFLRMAGASLTDKGLTAEPPQMLADPNAGPAQDIPGTVANSPFPGGRLLTKGATFNQENALRDDARAQAQVEAQGDRDEATARYRDAMLNRPTASDSKKQWVMRNGKPEYVDDVLPGDTPYSAPRSTSETAQDRQRKGRLEAAQGFLTRLDTLREKINTKIGPQAGLSGTVRQGVAAIGWDPDVAEYERIRAAGGRSLAVAIMGAQNLSDQDANAWAGMLPGARTDAVTAKRLTEQVRRMLETTLGDNAESATPEPSDEPANDTTHPAIQKFGATSTWDGSKYVRQ